MPRKYDVLNNLITRLKPKPPEIGGFVAIGTAVNNRTENQIFEGIFDTPVEAQTALDKAGYKDWATAMQKIKDRFDGEVPEDYEMEMGYAWEALVRPTVTPITKRLREAIEDGKADIFIRSPEWLGVDEVRIGNNLVASTYEEGTTFRERLRNDLAEYRTAAQDMQKYATDLLKSKIQKFKQPARKPTAPRTHF